MTILRLLLLLLLLRPYEQAPDDNGKGKLPLILQRSWNTQRQRGGDIERKEKDKKREARDSKLGFFFKGGRFKSLFMNSLSLLFAQFFSQPCILKYNTAS